MATADCAVCELLRATDACSECKMPLCSDCLVRCQTCEKSLCPRHVKMTKRGRKLCRACRDERRAERKRRRDEETAKPAAPAEEKVEKMPAFESEGSNPMAFSSLQKGFGEGATVDPKVLDERRPILKSSQYQPPSKKAYAFAFILFGISLVAVFISVPDLRQIAWPFETKGPDFNERATVVIQDTNALRDTSNISQLNIIPQVLLTSITWAFFVAYIVLAARVAIPVLGIGVPKVLNALKPRQEKDYF